MKTDRVISTISDALVACSARCALFFSVLSLTACSEPPESETATKTQIAAQVSQQPAESAGEPEKPILRRLNPDAPNLNNPACNRGASASADGAGQGVNWAAVTTEVSRYAHNCEKLSDYNFFLDPTDPTQGLTTASGTFYAMNTELFTDYASKYRFVVMPEGSSAVYMAQETFQFPVGTVLIKSFALPADTSRRGFVREELIETRLLIKRESGWVALPYVWNDDYSDAQLTAAPIAIGRSLVHQGEKLSFNYGVPGRDQCTTCHNVTKPVKDPTGLIQQAGFAPVGPKARNLNLSVDFGQGEINQLRHWQQLGLLSGLPDDLQQVAAVTPFSDKQPLDLQALEGEVLAELAKGYLDINCAHCHREEGKAKSSGLYLPHWLSYQGNEALHGKCKPSLTSTKSSAIFGVWPGDAGRSLLHYRMAITDGEKMPELGRELVHREGLALIGAWIDALPVEECG